MDGLCYFAASSKQGSLRGVCGAHDPITHFSHGACRRFLSTLRCKSRLILTRERIVTLIQADELDSKGGVDDDELHSQYKRWLGADAKKKAAAKAAKEGGGEAGGKGKSKGKGDGDGDDEVMEDGHTVSILRCRLLMPRCRLLCKQGCQTTFID